MRRMGTCLVRVVRNIIGGSSEDLFVDKLY